MLASGDYPDLILTDWPTVFTKSDIMQYGVKEGVLLPITDYIDKYGNNMKRVLSIIPATGTDVFAPDGRNLWICTFLRVLSLQRISQDLSATGLDG